MNDETYSTEVRGLVETKLCDLLPVLIHNELTYALRGVVNYIRGLSKLRTSVGHYTAYCKRSKRN